MNSETLAFLYNCSAWVLERNVTLLLRLNYTELLSVVHEALNSSDRSDFLRDRIVDCVFANQERPFNLPWWQKLLWSLIYTIIVLVAIGGNSIVMWIVLDAFRKAEDRKELFLYRANENPPTNAEFRS
ncbi:Tachykinin-like peptides receptor 86C [Harpegnathos saltator]|uniref:Tachykinin-like peptides receptor 86C n=1 Tax=Harpegnathos saltator TaxID=610380 RepID=E2B748_HARSA|nr:Tachykinin-like peptides receptor 86C [Harpegnathos saltator]